MCIGGRGERIFIYLGFGTIIEVGEGQKPLTILIDGDNAMANAIKVVFPKTRHRL